MRINKKIAGGVAAGAVLLAGGGAAWAYWTSSGSGTGTASTSAGVNSISVANSSATPLTAMYPGDSAQPLKATVTNTSSSQKAYVTSVKAYLTVSKATGAPAGTCDSSDYLLDGTAGTTAASPVTLNWTAQELAANSSADTGTGDSIQFNNKPAAQDACKGATVTINYVAS
jgi:hypothetical protein